MAIKLARLPTTWQAQPKLVERYWDASMTEIEKTLNAILAIPLIEDALADLDTAIAAADAAAAAANAAASSVTSESSIIASFPDNFVAPLISANSTGDVTIANHDRVYGDPTLNPTVSVVGATIATGATNPDVIRVYYVDPTRAGGTVTYLYTTDPSTPPVQGGNIHSVGAVEIPAAGSQNGNGVKPPGYVEP